MKNYQELKEFLESLDEDQLKQNIKVLQEESVEYVDGFFNVPEGDENFNVGAVFLMAIKTTV